MAFITGKLRLHRFGKFVFHYAVFEALFKIYILVFKRQQIKSNG